MYKCPRKTCGNPKKSNQHGISSVMVVNCGLTDDHAHVGDVGSARPGKCYLILVRVVDSLSLYRCIFGDRTSHPL